MKMKVKVADLRKAIEAHVAADEKRFAKESAAYGEAKEKARERHISNVRKYLAEITNGGDARDSYDLRNHLDKGVKWPTKPSAPKRYDAILTKLALSVDPVVTVDDRSEYMRILSDKCVCQS